MKSKVIGEYFLLTLNFLGLPNDSPLFKITFLKLTYKICKPKFSVGNSKSIPHLFPLLRYVSGDLLCLIIRFFAGVRDSRIGRIIVDA